MKLLIMLDLGAQVSVPFGQLRLTRDEFRGFRRLDGKLFKRGRLFFVSRHFAPQALNFARGFFALVGEMLVARRGLFDLAQSGLDVEPLAGKPVNALLRSFSLLGFPDALFCLRVLLTQSGQLSVQLQEPCALALGLSATVPQPLTLAFQFFLRADVSAERRKQGASLGGALN